MAQEPTSKGGKPPLRIGKYEVIARIATGGMGTVWKAVDTDLRRPVALKIMSAEMAAKPNMVKRFKREGQAAAKLQHENIVAVYECGEDNGTHFLALEFVEGTDLHDYIARRGQLEVEEARQILIQAAKALEHSHRHNIIHRDIKPSNFLISRHERGHLLVKLTDLGVAREVNDDDFRLTKPETTVGTVDYMAPEQAQSSITADIRSDIYSLGCTFYHMLGGRCPFPTGSLVDRIMKHREVEPPDIRTLNPSVPPDVVSLLQKMMAKKPEERYQTPQELLRELENSDHFPKSASPAEPPVRPLDTGPQEKYFQDPSDPDEPQLRPLDPGPEVKRAPESLPEPARTVKPRAKPIDDIAAEPEPVVQRRDKMVLGKRKRFRDQTQEFSTPKETIKLKDAPKTKKKKQSQMPRWWPWAAAGGTAALLTTVVFLSLPGPEKPRSQSQAPDPPRIVAPAVPTNVVPEPDRKPPAKNDPAVVLVGPAEPALPRLFQSAAPLDPAALRQEFLGPFQKEAVPPAEAKVAKVRRLPAAGEYHSIAEALAKTEGPLLLEIHDQGPIFEPSLAEVRDRVLWIRAGPGYRPLLAWDVSGSKDKSTSSFLAISGGSLTLEDIDVVLKWPIGRGNESACLFAVRDGSFHARNCTFSLAGKAPRGLVLVRMERSKPVAADPNMEQAAQVQLTHCYVRGSDLVVLDAKGTPIETLFEGSLLVGGDNPVVRLVGNDEDGARLRLVRSTVVCNQTFVNWKSLAGKPGSPRLNVLAWDALIARANINAPQGDMVFLGDGANLLNVSWRPLNCVYAGWKRLLYSTDKSIGAGALGTWRAIWSIRDGDLELSDTWPTQQTTEPETQPASLFTPYETPALFAASVGSGPLGCALGRLPAEPALWLQRTYDRYPLSTVPLPDADGPPPIAKTSDGYYHGETLDVTKFDLGSVLQARLQAAKPGPRVVLHLTGRGKQLTSAIKVRGVPHLVLFFESAADDPLTLLANPRFVKERLPLIDVEDGNLELIQARFLLDNKKTGIVPKHLIRVRGGDLIVNGCYLQGALDKAPDSYQGLIRWEENPNVPRAASVLLQNSALLSTRYLLDLRGSARLRMRNCAALAVEDGLVFTAAPQTRPNVSVQLEHNTLAARKALMVVRPEGERAGGSAGIVVQAEQNFMLAPFADQPSQARLLRISEAGLAAGIFLWQGKENAFDHLRLHGYFSAAPEDPARQSIKDWQQLWGSAGEQDPTLVDPAKAKAFTVDPPSWPHLALPPQVHVGAGPPPFGADLVGLGLVKRKG